MKTLLSAKAIATAAPAPWRARGSILGVVLLLLLVFTMIGLGLLSLSSYNGLAAGKAASDAQAFWTADAGIQNVRSLATKNNTVPFENMGLGSLPLTITGNTLAGSGTPGAYTVKIISDPAWPSGSVVKKYIITSTGLSQGGATRVIILRAELWTFANYMHASHFEQTPDGTPIYFASNDVVDGPVYVNGRINIWATPTFLQLVRSAASSVNYMNGGTVAVFKGGLGLNAPSLDFQGLNSIDPIASVKGKAGLALSGNYNLVFASNGTVSYTPAGGGVPQTRNLTSLNGAIYINGNAYVQGVVNGMTTVAAENSVYIKSSITYAGAAGTNDPWNSNFKPANVDDALGLMARQRVEVMGTSPVAIHAAIMVSDDAGGSNWGFNTTNKTANIGQPKLSVYGSISQYRRGVVGYVSGQGFAKNYKFDSRLTNAPPPWWPYSTYLLTNWYQSK